jgi:adenylate cyclase
LRGHLRDLVDPKIKEHRGRIVKNAGDGLLAEFSSVVDAVRCAVEMQRAMADRNAETVEDRRVTFRVGINLGDVIAEKDEPWWRGLRERRDDSAASAESATTLLSTGNRRYRIGSALGCLG